MDFFCPNCGRNVPCEIVTTNTTVTVANVTVYHAPQKRAYCQFCRAELFLPELAEENDYVARHAYCIQQSRGG